MVKNNFGGVDQNGKKIIYPEEAALVTVAKELEVFRTTLMDQGPYLSKVALQVEGAVESLTIEISWEIVE